VELRQLEYFVAVARHRHFTRAAEELYVTQPALSQQVRRLEAELGLALLRRTSRGIELTPAGEDLLVHAQKVIAEVGAARTAMDEHAGVERGFVRVAAPAVDALRLPRELAEFHRDHPGIRLGLRQASPRDVIALVQRGAVDMGVVSLPDGGPDPGVRVERLSDDALRVLVPIGEGGEALWDLRDRPWILPERGTGLRDVAVLACQAAGFSPVPQFEVADPATVHFLVQSGLGVSIVPEAWIQLGDTEALPIVPAEFRYRLSLVAPAAGLTPAAALLHERLSG
jgi:DNA-binding transcriptional LysR family regulator